jgi:hypothetical protein
MHHDSDPLDRFVCHYCNKRFVVPSLARYCESHHEDEDDD